MACKPKVAKDAGPASKKVLRALADSSEPASAKELAECAGLDAKVVADELKSLKTKGFIDCPIRCKYALTPAGEAELEK